MPVFEIKTNKKGNIHAGNLNFNTSNKLPPTIITGMSKRARHAVNSYNEGIIAAKLPEPIKISPLCDTQAVSVSTVPTPATTFTYNLISKSINENLSSRGSTARRHSVLITLSIPTDDEECPLTLESIAESNLPCLPGVSFLRERPLHTKLTLPCNHSFSAISLVYSFCKNSMTCPCCRYYLCYKMCYVMVVL
jgi:hypothetical protein